MQWSFAIRATGAVSDRASSTARWRNSGGYGLGIRPLLLSEAATSSQQTVPVNRGMIKVSGKQGQAQRFRKCRGACRVGAAGVFGDAGQEESKPAQDDVRADAIFLVSIYAS
jgi:hypothetical protein